MALSTIILDGRVTQRLVKQTAAGNTADNDVVGKAPTLYGVRIKNLGVAAATSWVKLYDAKSATNTDHPHFNLEVLAASDLNIQFPLGIVFANGLCLRASSEADDTAGATAPADNINVVLLTN